MLPKRPINTCDLLLAYRQLLGRTLSTNSQAVKYQLKIIERILTCRERSSETGEVVFLARGGVIPDTGVGVVDTRSTGIWSLPVQSVAT